MICMENKILEFCKIEERQLKGELEARNLIKRWLSESEIQYFINTFYTEIPFFKKYELYADNQKIDCLPVGLVSGKIDCEVIINSLKNDEKYKFVSNINYNPKCIKKISKCNFYFAPSVSVNTNDVEKLKKRNVCGYVEVEKIKHESAHIIVGNMIYPEIIIFAHYDSIRKGAIDNASGVVLLIEMLIKKKIDLNKCLIVFDGNEELSYDEDIYWGKGYREFESKYFNLFEECRKIIVVDCIGFSKPQIYNDLEMLKLGFPIKNLDIFCNKIKILSGDFDKLMEVYHSDADDVNMINKNYLEECGDELINMIK
jgi:hypothetical protein